MAVCMRRSSKFGIPSSRVPPSGLSMHTRRTACGRYVPSRSCPRMVSHCGVPTQVLDLPASTLPVRFRCQQPAHLRCRPQSSFCSSTGGSWREDVQQRITRWLIDHLRRLPPHGLSPRRSCPRLVLSSTSYPFGIMTPVEETGTKYRGLSPHKITPMLGVLHAEARWFGFTNGESTHGPR